MGREATKAAGNPWYEARIRASQYDDGAADAEASGDADGAEYAMAEAEVMEGVAIGGKEE